MKRSILLSSLILVLGYVLPSKAADTESQAIEENSFSATSAMEQYYSNENDAPALFLGGGR
jgi:hypothetical protein